MSIPSQGFRHNAIYPLLQKKTETVEYNRGHMRKVMDSYPLEARDVGCHMQGPGGVQHHMISYQTQQVLIPDHYITTEP